MTCSELDDVLDAYLDGTLVPAQREIAEAHLAGCPECRVRADALRSLLADARALPPEIRPARELWPEIASRLDASVVRVFKTRPQPKRRWAPLAAAAVLLVAVSVLLTLQFATSRTTTPALPPVAGVIPAGTKSMDADFVRAAVDLEQALAEQRDHLAPSTIATLERNLAVIDRAIEESRAALAADPANRDLRALLLGAHRQKLDLLERATRSTRS
ncbi:MAG TPA: zf-HC2 domain-containing protein [Gemmatimonadales bacterium]|nr:zf-HC2 domain-containing protein [Gemmatimonadales bacterium]